MNATIQCKFLPFSFFSIYFLFKGSSIQIFEDVAIIGAPSYTGPDNSVESGTAFLYVYNNYINRLECSI